MPHSQRQLGAAEGPNYRQNDDDDSPSTIPHEIYIRKRTDASTCKTSSTGSSGSRSSGSSNHTRGRLRFSFLARKSTQLLDAFRHKDREAKRKRLRVADEEDNEQAVGDSTGSTDINQNRLHDEAAEASAQAPPPPPSYDEALRLGLFKRPSQRESIEITRTAFSSEGAEGDWHYATSISNTTPY